MPGVPCEYLTIRTAKFQLTLCAPKKRSRNWFFVSLHLTKSKLTSTNHECPMSGRFPERGLSYKTVFLLQKRLMSSMASQNTRRKYAPLKTNRTNRAWFGQFVWIHGTSSQGFHHQFPLGKEEVLKYTKQQCSACKIYIRRCR